jgi:transcriptional regulator with XRE-family HTH domain
LRRLDLPDLDLGNKRMRKSSKITLAEVLRQFRSDARLSQEDLAERAGLSPRTVSNIETGAAPSPRAITISLLAEALGLDAERRERLFAVSRTHKATLAAMNGDLHADWLEPFGRVIWRSAGDQLFAKGEPGDRMYLIVSGTVRLAESAVVLGPGSFVGEIAIFSPDARRTQSVAAISECRFIELSKDEMPTLHRRFPEFSAHLLRLVTSRLLENTGRLQARGENSEMTRSPAA